MRSTRGEFQHLFWGLYAPVTGGAVVLVLIATILLVLRYRGTHRPAARSSNVTLELVAACALAAIAAVLLTETFSAEGSVDELHRPGLVVDATGFQWGWTFAYPGTGVSIRLRSRDVIHALWVPEQRFKRLAFPDRVTRFDLRFDRAGRFEGRCSTFCGLRHDVMTFVVDARRAADFRRWLRQQETQA
jgi:cytochrome c oxidase subunit 2